MKNMQIKGLFRVQHLDKEGNLKGAYDVPNGIVDEGLNHILDTQFHAGTPVSPWYIGLIDNLGFSALANGDTAAEINGTNGWDELSEYTEGIRQEWTEGAAAARSMTNAVTVDFSINATKTIKGIFVVSTSTVDGVGGEIWSTAAFASTVSAVNGDTLKITYTVSG